MIDKKISPVTILSEGCFVSFDYSYAPLEVHVLYGFSDASELVQVTTKLCKHGHYWKDVRHSLRHVKSKESCCVCKRISHRKQVNSGKNAEAAASRYAANRDKHNAQTMASYWRHRDQRLESGARQRAARRDRIKSGLVEPFYNGKPCRRCGETLRYSICSDCVQCAKNRADEWRHANPERVLELHRAWNEANRDKLREYRKKWIEENPDKYREVTNRSNEVKKNAHTVPFTPEQLYARLTTFDFSCAYCGEVLQLEKKRGWAMDHFIPKSKGGSNSLSNYLPSCNRCNYKKSDKDPWEWYSSYEHFSRKRWRQILDALGKKQSNYTQIPFL